MALRAKTPGLLRRMSERQVGDIVVFRNQIIEPKTGCTIARGFPNEAAALAAANEMNEVADWFGLLKARAAGAQPNCQTELCAIAERHAGQLAGGASEATVNLCAEVVARYERSA